MWWFVLLFFICISGLPSSLGEVKMRDGKGLGLVKTILYLAGIAIAVFVAGFYANETLSNRAKTIVLEQIEKDLKITAGQTTPDLKFTVEAVNCIGACALGPMVIVGEDYHGEMTPEGIVSVLKEYN